MQASPRPRCAGRLGAAHRCESPAVSFYLLPLDDMDSDEDLYIKMNSRGKPLTQFENFKAHFEQDIKHRPRSTTSPTRSTARGPT